MSEPNQPGGPVSEIYEERTILDTDELKNFCDQTNLEFHVINLNNLAQFDGKYAFVHTGEKNSFANKGNENHWLALYGNYIFDSYGYTTWSIPEGFTFVQTIPKRLQSWNSNVCGAYCCAFLWFCENNPYKLSNVGRSFCQQFHFGKNTEENDRKILTYFENVTPTLP